MTASMEQIIWQLHNQNLSKEEIGKRLEICQSEVEKIIKKLSDKEQKRVETFVIIGVAFLILLACVGLYFRS
jgi:hypothetical protein